MIKKGLENQRKNLQQLELKNEKTLKEISKIKRLKKAKGITLIALIITIIILIILAGITLVALSGENGILRQASKAKEETEIASVREQAQLDITNWVADKIENGKDATVNTPQKVQEILNSVNQNNENKYYKGFTDTGITTPNGYEVPYEELYTNGTTGGEVTEVTAANYGNKVDYVSKGDSSLIWRIFYDDEDYVYLISSKKDGSTTIEKCQLNTGSAITYSGSADITDSFLQSLNSQWFDFVKDVPSTDDTAKAIAYLMDQDVWDEYKDSEGNASYAIGGATLELFKNSYNKSEETTNEIEIISCTSIGYRENTSNDWLLEEYNNGIYCNNREVWWLASPYENNRRKFLFYSSYSRQVECLACDLQ